MHALLAQLFTLDRRYGCPCLPAGSRPDGRRLGHEPDACGEPGTIGRKAAAKAPPDAPDNIAPSPTALIPIPPTIPEARVGMALIKVAKARHMMRKVTTAKAKGAKASAFPDAASLIFSTKELMVL